MEELTAESTKVGMTAAVFAFLKCEIVLPIKESEPAMWPDVKVYYIAKSTCR
jgi:hypothetical protein